MKSLYILSWLVIISAIALMLLFGFWMLYPYKPIVYNDPVYPILNENKTATVGGILSYEVDYCKYTDIYPEVFKRYVDGIIYQTPPGRGIVYQGCRVQQVDNLVPTTLIPGKYKMEVIVDYQMNPIRHIIFTNYTEDFTIVAKE